MKIASKKGPFVLFLGDLFFFVLSLWLALFLRAWSAPKSQTFFLHLVPFSLLFSVWVVVFYIAGLYGKQTVMLKSKLPSTLLNTHLANSFIAVVFFYFVPLFGITPKTVLFIYLVISFFLILFWRMYLYFFLVSRKPDKAIIIGVSKEAKELHDEITRNDIYNIRFVPEVTQASIVIADFNDEILKPRLPELYEGIFSGVNFIDINKIYEDIFERVPLSLLKYNWFIENVSSKPSVAYDSLKRLMDIILALVLGLISLILYPFIILAIKLDDGGPIFITQERIGQNSKIILVRKFRSMERNDVNLVSASHRNNKITRVGKVLRNTRIDELPQLWSILAGDQSLIGPRPELPSGVVLYNSEIPYYNVRHMIKPGLSGWAQIYQENHPHHGEAVDETKEKLSYDLYYVKNRSLVLDLKIALRTVKTLLSRAGK